MWEYHAIRRILILDLGKRHLEKIYMLKHVYQDILSGFVAYCSEYIIRRAYYHSSLQTFVSI